MVFVAAGVALLSQGREKELRRSLGGQQPPAGRGDLVRPRGAADDGVPRRVVIYMPPDLIHTYIYMYIHVYTCIFIHIHVYNNPGTPASRGRTASIPRPLRRGGGAVVAVPTPGIALSLKKTPTCEI